VNNLAKPGLLLNDKQLDDYGLNHYEKWHYADRVANSNYQNELSGGAVATTINNDKQLYAKWFPFLDSSIPVDYPKSVWTEEASVQFELNSNPKKTKGLATAQMKLTKTNNVTTRGKDQPVSFSKASYDFENGKGLLGVDIVAENFTDAGSVHLTENGSILTTYGAGTKGGLDLWYYKSNDNKQSLRVGSMYMETKIETGYYVKKSDSNAISGLKAGGEFNFSIIDIEAKLSDSISNSYFKLEYESLGQVHVGLGSKAEIDITQSKTSRETSGTLYRGKIQSSAKFSVNYDQIFIDNTPTWMHRWYYNKN
jgi:hypothetical protein